MICHLVIWSVLQLPRDVRAIRFQFVWSRSLSIHNNILCIVSCRSLISLRLLPVLLWKRPLNEFHLAIFDVIYIILYRTSVLLYFIVVGPYTVLLDFIFMWPKQFWNMQTITMLGTSGMISLPCFYKYRFNVLFSSFLSYFGYGKPYFMLFIILYILV